MKITNILCENLWSKNIAADCREREWDGGCFNGGYKED